MNKSEYQNPKSETNSNDKNTKFKIVSSFDIRISSFKSERGLASLKLWRSGQALITLIFFVLIAITIASGAIIMLAVNSTSLVKLQEGTISYNMAESGIENAMLRVLRDPNNYTGETLTVDNAAVIITVSPTGNNFPKTITAYCTSCNFKRTVTAKMNYTSGSYTFSNWKEN